MAGGEIRVVDGGGKGLRVGEVKRRGDKDWVLRGDSPAFGMIRLVGNRGGAFQGTDIRRNGGEEGGVIRWGGEAEE